MQTAFIKFIVCKKSNSLYLSSEAIQKKLVKKLWFEWVYGHLKITFMNKERQLNWQKVTFMKLKNVKPSYFTHKMDAMIFHLMQVCQYQFA